jgi:7-carboxy-7-deazaguanine synthase
MFLVHEIFASIQGEGIRTGIPSVFVRLAGCNLECIWCDTSFSRSERGAEWLTAEEMISRIRSYRIENVCLTGGEPLCHEALPDLVSSLLLEGYNVDLETNGSIDVGSLVRRCPAVFLSMDVKTPSSGMGGSFEMANLSYLRPSDQLKFIISDEADLEFTFGFLLANNPRCNIILTPCDNEGASRIVLSVLERSKRSIEAEDQTLIGVLSRTRTMLQTHKVIWGNEKGR